MMFPRRELKFTGEVTAKHREVFPRRITFCTENFLIICHLSNLRKRSLQRCCYHVIPFLILKQTAAVAVQISESTELITDFSGHQVSGCYNPLFRISIITVLQQLEIKSFEITGHCSST